jgi:hypothetical protein
MLFVPINGFSKSQEIPAAMCPVCKKDTGNAFTKLRVKFSVCMINCLRYASYHVEVKVDVRGSLSSPFGEKF